ncbi:nucleoside phosphorylase [Paenibacillus aurantius]|uniref:Uridine phosphorylase n=1 Tax=Paenibacillus aurantius TaxID=2918900 RepID=A0AA96LDG7_9BACL|nr:nucleoside phosphorylase [Paenibacillus aurantius]WJH36631.1 nucleoside phosphorylase [Paenibacillus sp. CC-CFT747]WNQ11979.1 nucleoside phosphorylase [Paenibacillus aurantius]
MALLPILRVDPADMPDYALVCGDPFRAEEIAKKLTDAKELAHAREYRTFTGTYEGVKLAVVSHGVGSPGAAVCFEELAKAGVKTIIRIGTAGSLSSYRTGSLIVSTAAVREEGLTRQLVPLAFPAVADSRVTEALYEAALEVDAPGEVGKGVTLTMDAFFSGVVELPHETYRKAGVLAVEMEIAALYVVAMLRGVRAGAILALDGDSTAVDEGYNPHRDVVTKAVEAEIAAALRAVVKLAKKNAE